MPRPTSALIVDDESHVRVYLRMLLKQLGITTVWEASDGAKARELYIEHRPGVVLMDIVMPGKTGPGVMADLKAIDPNVPVIVVTSQVALKTVEEMHALGAMSYVLKHTPRDQMLKMLSDTLDSIGEET
jgi:two-component system, chemotaxis family, chemotaxis protein CheY